MTGVWEEVIGDWVQAQDVFSTEDRDFIFTDNGIFYKSITETSWQKLNLDRELDWPRCITTIGDTILVGDTFDIIVSTNNGNTWESRISGIRDVYVFNDFEIAPDNAVLAFASHSGIYRKAPNGDFFEPFIEDNINIGRGSIDNNLLRYVTENYIKVYDFDQNKLIDSISTGNISFEDNLIHHEGSYYINSEIDGVNKYNGSTGWESFNNGFTTLHVNDLAITDSKLVVATDSGVYVTSLPENNWVKLEIDTQNTNPFHKIFVMDSLIFANSTGYSYISSNNGETWSQIEALDAVQINDMDWYDNKIVALGNGSLFYSSDYGNTWSPSNLIENYSFSDQMIFENDMLYLGILEEGVISFSVKNSQQINFDLNSAYSVGIGTINLNASSSSGLPISYSSSNESILTIAKEQAILLDTGQVTLTAHQLGNLEYTEANDVSRTITIYAKSSQEIDFQVDSVLSIEQEGILLEAQSTSGLVVQFESDNPEIASILSDSLILNSTGTVTLTAYQNGDSLYLPAESISRIILIISPQVVTAVESIIEFSEIYPNPNEGIFEIKLPSKTSINNPNLAIFSIDGRAIGFKVIDNANDHVRIQLRERHKGVYLIYISDNYVGRFIVD